VQGIMGRVERNCGAIEKPCGPDQIRAGKPGSLPDAWSDRARSPQSYSFRNASDCRLVISNGLRQRTFMQESLSSRRTMYDCALANLARSRSSAWRGNWALFRLTTQVTLYSPACPHLGQVKVCVRISVVSLKKSLSSIVFTTPLSEKPPWKNDRAFANQNPRYCRLARTTPY